MITAELHDGTRLEFPDGTDPAVVQRTVQGVLAQRQTPQKPASMSVGESIRDIPRQVGLTARYGLESLGGIADIGTEPIRQMVVNPLMRLVQGDQPTTASSSSAGANSLADMLGLPKPRTANERVVGDMTRMVGSSAGMAGGAKAVANMTRGTPAVIAEMMAARPGAQMVAGATAGGAGGAVREAGGGPWEQFGAALLGGLSGAGGVGAAGSAVDATKRIGQRIGAAMNPQAATQAADLQIMLAAQRSGLDWQAVPAVIKAQLRQEVADSLATGQPLNQGALRRLLVFRNTGTTPTVGQLTQDPGLITREMNLAKTGANSTDTALQALPQLQNQNTAQLLRLMGGLGANRAPDEMRAGASAIGGLSSTAAAEKAKIDALYAAARDTQGRSLPLEAGAFTRRASELLDEAMAGGALPRDVQNRLNQIAIGEYPLTVASAEDLKRVIGQLQRGASDGSTRFALGKVRQALDETPLLNDRVNPGNLPAIPGSVPPSISGAGQEAIDAFNAARAANRAWMGRVESTPGLAAVVEGIEPDRFVRQFVLSGSQPTKAVRNMVAEMGPQARQDVRDYIVRYLRDRATNNTDDITKFSYDGIKTALRDLGDDKLALFFNRDEMKLIQDIRDTAKYMSAQPAGSAVNNSNSGALVLGRGLDTLERVVSKVPVAGGWMAGKVQGLLQGQQMDPRNALRLMLSPEDQQAVPALYGLLAAPGVARGDDERRNKPTK